MLAWRSIWTFLQQPPLSRFYSYFKSAFLRRLFCVTVFCLENFFNFLLHFSWLLFAGLIDFVSIIANIFWFVNKFSETGKLFIVFIKIFRKILNSISLITQTAQLDYKNAAFLPKTAETRFFSIFNLYRLQILSHNHMHFCPAKYK